MGIPKKESENYKMAQEICFEAPEINMASDIVLDARVSVVTVAKLVDVAVTGNCKCPSGSSGNFESIEKPRNVSAVFERAPARAAPRSVTSSESESAPKVMTSFSGNRITPEPSLKHTVPTSTSEPDDVSIEQPLSSSLRPSSVAKPSVTDIDATMTDATI